MIHTRNYLASTEEGKKQLMQGGYVNPMMSYANHMMVEQYINQKNDVEIKHFGSTMLEGYKQYCKEGAITLILSEVELLKLSGNIISKTKIGQIALSKGSEYLSGVARKIEYQSKLFVNGYKEVKYWWNSTSVKYNGETFRVHNRVRHALQNKGDLKTYKGMFYSRNG